jgi:diaminopimelate decarboxylase
MKMDEKSIKQAASQYQTPFYVFDFDMLETQIHKIRAALDANVGICYAMKANPFLIKKLENIVDCIEVCSPGEFHICERAEINMDKVVMSGVNKKQSDVEYLLNRYSGKGVITAESFSQWQMIENYAAKHKLPVRVLLRLTIGNQFGMDETVIRQIIENRSSSPYVHIEGIQFFSSTQKKSSCKFETELSMLKNLCSDLQHRYGFTVEKLEYGPGLPVCYFQDEADVEDTMLAALAEGIKALNFSGKITLEIGRYIAASCGYYVTSVIDVKVNKGHPYCIVDGGIHHLNYYGQMMAMKKPPVLHLNKRDGELSEWTICGSLCTMNDVLVKQYPFRALCPGDTLAFGKAGAYSVTEGMSLFLSHELPQIITYSKQDGYCLARDNFPTDRLNYYNK